MFIDFLETETCNVFILQKKSEIKCKYSEVYRRFRESYSHSASEQTSKTADARNDIKCLQKDRSEIYKVEAYRRSCVILRALWVDCSRNASYIFPKTFRWNLDYSE